MRRSSRGATLIELIVTVVLLGIIASVATLALRRMPKPAPDDPTVVIADTLAWVLASGHSVTLQFVVNRRPVEATLNPDGSIIADTALHIDRLTGRMRDAR